MIGDDCTNLLKWCLPPLGMRWAGFRRVRRQVCRRISRRIAELDLRDAGAYRAYLVANPGEWKTLDAMCRITISRFFRDRVLFERLRDVVLPDLIGRLGPEERELRAWSIGCASGEEAYSLRILWDLDLGPRCSPFSLQIAATDVDAQLLCRAAVAVYPASALREVPARWRERAFERSAGRYRLRDRFRRGVEFRERDVRAEAPAPEPRFHLVLCRNLVFTYFSEPLQLEVVDRLRAATEPGGALVVGTHERLPAAARGFMPWPGVRCVYRGHSSPLQ